MPDIVELSQSALDGTSVFYLEMGNPYIMILAGMALIIFIVIIFTFIRSLLDEL